jgi:hypothetical protein
MVNYKQLITDLSSIAYHHEQIKSFGYGDLKQITSDIVTKQEPEYTRMYMVPGEVTLNQNHIHYMFSVVIADIVNDDLSNLKDVVSDTLEVTKDIWTILFHSYTAEQGDFSWEINADIGPDVVPFLERFDTILAGWTMNINIYSPFDYNECTPPVEFGFGFPQDESFASYRVVIDDFEKFALLHHQVNSFGFGDTFQITNDIITKKEPEYPRMYVIPDITRFQSNHMHIFYKIIMVDQLNDDLSNQADVLSDTLEIVKDLFSKLYLSEYEADWDAKVYPFLEEFETTLAGWTLEVSIQQKFDYNRCVIPERSFIKGYKWEELVELWKNVATKWKNI